MGNHERELLCFCAKRHKRAMTVLGSGGEHQPLCVCVCVCVFVCVCVCKHSCRQRALEDAQGSFQGGAVLTKGKPLSPIPLITL